jgi:hypothetical protein
VLQFSAELLSSGYGTKLLDSEIDQMLQALTLILPALLVCARVCDQLIDAVADGAHSTSTAAASGQRACA